MDDSDFYAHNAEWYGALIASGRAERASVVRHLLGEVRGGDFVEVGAGIGACLATWRDLGAARIHAVEPSPSMRIGLMTTVAADPDLLARTTILAGDLASALVRLPARWAGAAMLDAVGHLDDDARAHLWRTLAERLAPDGRFVLTLQPPAEPTAIPWTDFGAVGVGEHEIRTRGRADPAGERRVDWTMEWSLHAADGELLDRRSAVSRWRTTGADDVVAEASAVGLRLLDQTADGTALALGRD